MSRLPEPQTTEHGPDVTEEPTVPDDSFTVLSDLLPNAEACKEEKADRIFGGKKASDDEYPWVVLLEYNKRNYKVLLIS